MCVGRTRTAGRFDVETAALASNVLRVGMREASDSSGELGIGGGLSRDLGESGRGAFDSEVGRDGLVKVKEAGGLGLWGEALEMAVVRGRSRRVVGTVSYLLCSASSIGSATHSSSSPSPLPVPTGLR